MQMPWYIGWTLVAAIGFGILSLAAARAPFYPLKYPSGFWDLQSELRAEDVWLRTADGVRLHAWWIAVPQTPLVTLYLHGNAGNVTLPLSANPRNNRRRLVGSHARLPGLWEERRLSKRARPVCRCR